MLVSDMSAFGKFYIAAKLGSLPPRASPNQTLPCGEGELLSLRFDEK
jgi:hypothetical protein